MKTRAKILFLILIAMLFLACTDKQTFTVSELLFGELTEAESLLDVRIRENNWKSPEALGKACRKQNDLERATAIFSTFYEARFDPEGANLHSDHIGILIEYATNLLKTTPDGSILVVYYDEVFHLSLIHI